MGSALEASKFGANNFDGKLSPKLDRIFTLSVGSDAEPQSIYPWFGGAARNVRTG
jgi:hypothetical protein